MSEPKDMGAQMLGIAARLRAARIEQGLTQAELAKRAGVSRPTVARVEAGEDVSTATLEKIAGALRLRVELHGEEPRPPRSKNVGGV